MESSIAEFVNKNSIKSQKSLHEECSEIFEKSYSVRSASLESLTCEEDDTDALSREFLHKLSPAALSRLRRRFRKGHGRDADVNRRVEEVMRIAAAEEGIEFAASAPVQTSGLWINEEGLVEAVQEIFGNSRYTVHARALFSKLSRFNTRVYWSQVVDALVACGDGSRQRWTPVKGEGARKLPHCKRETLVKLVSIETATSFCYAAVTRGGRVGVYDADLQLLHSYEIFYQRTGVQRRVKNCWITDAVYMSDVQCLVISASDRSLTVYECVTLIHKPVHCVTGLPHIPTCLCPSRAPPLSLLYVGSERGDVTLLRFLQPKVALFYTRSQETINYLFWMELPSPPHSHYVSLHSHRPHSRAVRRIVRTSTVLWSCSKAGMVAHSDVCGKLKFNVQGVSCFQVVSELHLLVTGSNDGIVRLFETTQSNPYATLGSPGSLPVLDLAVVPSQQIIVSCASNCSVNIWDLYEETLLQTVKIKFPFLGVLGKKVEFGPYCIFPGPARQKATEEEVPDRDISSRRSSIYQGATGGLVLQEESLEEWNSRTSECNSNIQSRTPLLLTCRDYLSVLRVSVPPSPRPALPPPRDAAGVRVPDNWDICGDDFRMSPPTPTIPEPTATSSLLTPTYIPPEDTRDIDELLEKAGLQGILEKDFVLMQGLKTDLNRKLHEIKINNQQCVTREMAPYLSLRLPHADLAVDSSLMLERYRRVMQLFPGPSITNTPTGSHTSTPRTNKSKNESIKF